MIGMNDISLNDISPDDIQKTSARTTHLIRPLRRLRHQSKPVQRDRSRHIHVQRIYPRPHRDPGPNSAPINLRQRRLCQPVPFGPQHQRRPPRPLRCQRFQL